MFLDLVPLQDVVGKERQAQFHGGPVLGIGDSGNCFRAGTPTQCLSKVPGVF